MTNATKALIIAFINAGLALAVGFGLNLTTEQFALIIAFIDAGMVLWIGLTYKESSTRLPEGVTKTDVAVMQAQTRSAPPPTR